MVIMKKLMYIATALLVLVGCNKDNALNNAPEGTPFKKGQQVTLTIGTGDNANQVAPRKVAGIDNTTDGLIEFRWEENDQILVKVGDATAEFTLISGAGTDAGEFAGVMPADGSTFDIQYPVEAPDLTAQVYSADKVIPADKMAFAASNCTLDNPATLAAQYAMVQLNLFGTDKTVGQIMFTNTTASPAESYTLTCTDGVTIGATSTAATPFYMVVSAGEYQFEVAVYDNATTPAKICSFATSAAKTFTAGECLNMPAKEVKEPFVPTYVDLGLPSGLKWATCNLGATTPEGYGDYFAWGETSPKEDYYWNTYKWCIYTESPKDINLTKYFVKYIGSGYIHGEVDNKVTLEPEDDAAHVNWGGNWRMPTVTEIEELMNTENCTWKWKDNYNNTGVNGHLVTSNKNSNSIFLPAAGRRSESGLFLDGDDGFYWSSSLYEDYSHWAFNLSINALEDVEDWKAVYKGHEARYCGQSVRPVCE